MTVDTAIEDATARDWERDDIAGTVELAVVGLGRFAREYAIPAVRDGDYCEVAAVVSGDPEKAASVADDAGAAALSYDEFRAGDAADACDAAYVATPNATHLEYARAAADRGDHVLVEKPMEVTADRGRELVDACAAADVSLMVAYRPQANPLVRRARELVGAGAIGDPVQLSGTFTGKLAEGDPDGWRFDPDLAGGGALYDVGVYPLDAARFVLDAEPTSVSASVAESEALAGLDEHVAFRLEFPGGATADCRASYRAQHDDALEIVGTEGALRLDGPFRAGKPTGLVLDRDDGRVEVGPLAIDDAREEFDYFGHHVRSGTAIEPDGEDGLADLRWMEAVYESAERGRRVALE